MKTRVWVRIEDANGETVQRVRSLPAKWEGTRLQLLEGVGYFKQTPFAVIFRVYDKKGRQIWPLDGQPHRVVTTGFGAVLYSGRYEAAVPPP